MVLGAVLLTYFQADTTWMTFMVVSSMFPQILVVGLLRLVAEMVVSLVGLEVHQLIFQFISEIKVLPSAAIMM